ncbi:(2Fe-2S)-binding protein [Halococcus saccharolyticus]|uniref:Aerobic-type carbon monoxide dehydrogenase small subunit n=1 Tax=Halococcus saccharolyticus DSM 5350 TaxID=1227455 RepID=M0MJD3_9EURY|nr:(2Fe-2S)-binding protein [Halococcus saccharolyticus]EMA44844.1 aerobic-type carbon monoxide dehydrogenase small subunit [Halococcus saccharolyticus DSM 5350]
MSADTPGDAAGRPTREVSLTVNGETVEAEVEPRLKLSDFLRNHCGLRGVRVGCEHGVCGACTVSLDGDIVKSCLVYAVQANGREVGTVEGLAESGELGPVQRAFHEEHALQCGFCTSGFVMATHDLLERNPDPSDEEIRKGLADNICRCTGYQNIYKAIHRAADEMDTEPTDATDTSAEEN